MSSQHREARLGVANPETISITNGASAAFSKTLSARKRCRLTANVEAWWRIGAAAAIGGATSGMVGPGKPVILVFDGTNGSVNVIADSIAGKATLEDIIEGQ